MARTQSPQLSMDGVGRGGKVKQQHNEQLREICKKKVVAGYCFSIYCIYQYSEGKNLIDPNISRSKGCGRTNE